MKYIFTAILFCSLIFSDYITEERAARIADNFYSSRTGQDFNVNSIEIIEGPEFADIYI